MTAASSAAAAESVAEIFERVASDLAMLADCAVEVGDVKVEDRTDRPAGADQVHISYRFGLEMKGGAREHGALLVPLPESIALAASLMMSPPEQVQSLRDRGEVDRSIKETMLEIGNFVVGAADAALHDVGVPVERVAFEGCQGVRADVRPRLDYEEGAPLVIGRTTFAVAGADPVEVILVLPAAALPK